MQIPHDALPAETLRNLIVEFITREGTYIGSGDEPDLDADIAQVMTQLEKGKVRITFDEETQTTSIERP